MKFPNNIILDLHADKLINNSQYWIINYLHNYNKNNYTFNTFNNLKIFNNSLKKNNQYFQTNLSEIEFEKKKKKFDKFFCINSDIDKKKKYKTNIYLSKNLIQILQNNFFYKKDNNKSKFDKKKKQIFDFLYSFSINNKKKNLIVVNNKISNFDIHFLKKEKIYTKLKYSRVPQYDIVSGGVAAIFAGFLGFLICEKFGFELLDSGDFYFLFMYVVFLSFFLRLFIKLINEELQQWNFYSIKWLLFYLQSLFFLIKNFFKIK